LYLREAEVLRVHLLASPSDPMVHSEAPLGQTVQIGEVSQWLEPNRMQDRPDGQVQEPRVAVALALAQECDAVGEEQP